MSGGWREFADTAVDFGIEAPMAVTRTELAETVGGKRTLVLAAVVDRAVFSPEESNSADADDVWKSVGELRDSLSSEKSWLERLKALISLRSFGR